MEVGLLSLRDANRTAVLTRDSTPKMHTVWVRLNAVVFFSFTVLISLAMLTACSTYNAYNPSGSGVPIVHKLEVRDLRSLRVHGGVDKAMLHFDLNVDLRPAFHWNVKQIFCMVVAEYEGVPKAALKESYSGPDPPVGTYPTNQVVIWDKIVEASDGGFGQVNFRTGIDIIDSVLQFGGGSGAAFGNSKGFFGGVDAGFLPEVDAASSSKKKKKKKKKKKDKTSNKKSGDPFIINLENEYVKYALIDRKDELRGANVTLKFVWDMMPMTSLMYMTDTPLKKGGGSSSFTMPREYTRTQEKYK